MNNKFKIVGKPIQKHDAQKLLLGKPMFADDFDSSDYLCIKLLRSPYASALIKNIDVSQAIKIPGIEAIYTYRDVPNNRFTTAGQEAPEPSPHDRLILDKILRFVGDPVAIVVGVNEKISNLALKKINVEYEVLEPLLDKSKALDNKILVHPEDNWKKPLDLGQDNKRNLAGIDHITNCDIEEELKKCDIVLSGSYNMKAFEQVPFESFRTFSKIDEDGKLHITSSTQIIYHLRRIISNALGIPQSKIVVDKLKVGGGFGTKQTSICDVYSAFVTWMTKKPSKIIYTRKECFEAGSPRHNMDITVTIGASKKGQILAAKIYNLSDTGAYSEHGSTTALLSFDKAVPLYSKFCTKFDYKYHVVYTNKQSSGAYRGFGATQGIFAFESMVNQLADKLNIDPLDFRINNLVQKGMVMPAYEDDICESCYLDKCLITASEKFKWKEKYPVRKSGNKIKSAGISIAMQGSSIKNIDKAAIIVKLDESGKYLLKSSACDMGTGCETILSQMVCEVLNCDMSCVEIIKSNTDKTPYDSGSYASSTTYLTGLAAKEASTILKNKIIEIAAEILNCKKENIRINNNMVISDIDNKSLSLSELYNYAKEYNLCELSGFSDQTSPVSPPPFMATMVEVEIDKETGICEITDYVTVIDCGTVINPNLAKLQAEGGIAQAIGHTLYENKTYNSNGKPIQNSLMQYKIPSRLDINNIRVYFEESDEPTGPFGAKSIGEVVTNGAAPAIAHAIYRSTGTWHKTLPITPDKILSSFDNLE